MKSISTIEEALEFIENYHAHDGTLVRFDGELQTLTIEIEGPGIMVKSPEKLLAVLQFSKKRCTAPHDSR